jgi:hypothetical protein
MFKEAIRKMWIILPLATLALGVVSYALSKTNQEAKAARIGYTVVQKRITVVDGAPPKVDWISVRASRSDGNFVEKRTDSSGKVIYLGFTHEGQFLAQYNGDAKLARVSDYNPEASGYSETALQSDPRLRKGNPNEWVQGEKCYALRIKEDEDGGYQDFYFSPKFNFPLGIIRKSGNNEQSLITVSIAYGEPDPALFYDLPVHLPIEPRPTR